MKQALRQIGADEDQQRPFSVKDRFLLFGIEA
jgi:hypothetical protein